MIDVRQCTLHYPSKKGITEVSFTVNRGEIFGYLGPNGAGKTTTIRALMGFMKPQAGQVRINGIDCWTGAAKIQRSLGYIPGELALFDDMSGTEFFAFMAQLRGTHDKTRLNALLNRFELDPKPKIRKMSKGMKQKVGLITAFMHDPDIYILDEPSSGLDPLMQQVFVDLILEEKQRGKTILMSSHSFDEVDKTCDRVAMIKDGKIAAIENIDTIKQHRTKTYVLTVSEASDITVLKQAGFTIHSTAKPTTIEIPIQGSLTPLLSVLKQINLIDLDVKSQKLEDVFMQYYGKGGQST
jgi:ABC-2 type transport system ATP-binding protein